MLMNLRNGMVAESGFMPATLDELAAKVRSFGTNRDLARRKLLGLVLPDSWTATDGTTYDFPWRVVDVNFYENAAGESLLHAIVMPVWANPEAVMFDNRNQEVATEQN